MSNGRLPSTIISGVCCGETSDRVGLFTAVVLSPSSYTPLFPPTPNCSSGRFALRRLCTASVGLSTMDNPNPVILHPQLRPTSNNFSCALNGGVEMDFVGHSKTESLNDCFGSTYGFTCYIESTTIHAVSSAALVIPVWVLQRWLHMLQRKLLGTQNEVTLHIWATHSTCALFCCDFL